MIYYSKHSFEKGKLSKFNEIPSIGSKFERRNKCYNKFLALMDVDIEPENAEHKLLVLDKVSKLYHDLITEYKKDYERQSKNDKSEAWKQKYHPKNLKDLNYQPAKLETKSMSDKKSGIDEPIQLKQLNLNEYHGLICLEKISTH